jgi:hypothetical protein
MKNYKKAYICSPYRGDVEKNVENAILLCKYALNQGYLPVCPHIYFPQFLNDNVAEERELGIGVGLNLLELCDVVFTFGNVSDGMKSEIEVAERLGLNIELVKFGDIAML